MGVGICFALHEKRAEVVLSVKTSQAGVWHPYKVYDRTCLDWTSQKERTNNKETTLASYI